MSQSYKRRLKERLALPQKQDVSKHNHILYVILTEEHRKTTGTLRQISDSSEYTHGKSTYNTGASHQWENMDDLRSGENWFTTWRKIKPDLYQYYIKDEASTG